MSIFNKQEIDLLYDIALKYYNNDIDREQLIIQLRGGGFGQNLRIAIIIIMILGILLNINPFQHPHMRGLVSLHL